MSRTGSHKAQHYIPSSYLAAWCDPDTPPRMHPYVWTFDPLGGAGRKRAPSNLFTETDIYTITMPDGSRDLRIEHELSKLEQGLRSLVVDYIARRRQLPHPRQARLIAFIAAMHGRTPQTREIQRKLWQDMLDLAEQQERDQLKALDTQRLAEITLRPAGARTNLDNLRRAINSPMQFLLPGAIEDGLPALSRMTMTIFCADKRNFITSDNPVIWFDPTVPRDKFLSHKSSLSDEGIEVAMPLSPWHMIVMHHPVTDLVKPVRYVRASASTVTALNKRTAHHAEKALVSWRDGFDPTWQIMSRIPKHDPPG